MDIDEARRRLAENPPQGDPTEIKFGETLADRAARLEGLGAMADVEAFTEYGWLVMYDDGSRGWLNPLGTDRDRSLAQFRMLEADMPEGVGEERLVFASRHVTHTPWAEESTGPSVPCASS